MCIWVAKLRRKHYFCSKCGFETTVESIGQMDGIRRQNRNCAVLGAVKRPLRGFRGAAFGLCAKIDVCLGNTA